MCGNNDTVHGMGRGGFSGEFYPCLSFAVAVGGGSVEASTPIKLERGPLRRDCTQWVNRITANGLSRESHSYPASGPIKLNAARRCGANTHPDNGTAGNNILLDVQRIPATLGWNPRRAVNLYPQINMCKSSPDPQSGSDIAPIFEDKGGPIWKRHAPDAIDRFKPGESKKRFVLAPSVCTPQSNTLTTVAIRGVVDTPSRATVKMDQKCFLNLNSHTPIQMTMKRGLSHWSPNIFPVFHFDGRSVRYQIRAENNPPFSEVAISPNPAGKDRDACCTVTIPVAPHNGVSGAPGKPTGAAGFDRRGDEGRQVTHIWNADMCHGADRLDDLKATVGQGD